MVTQAANTVPDFKGQSLLLCVFTPDQEACELSSVCDVKASVGMHAVISVLESLWPEDGCEFKISLGYIMSSRPAWATHPESASNKTNKKIIQFVACITS